MLLATPRPRMAGTSRSPRSARILTGLGNGCTMSRVCPIIPYRLAQVREAIDHGRLVAIVEGEAKADLLGKWGIAATCNAGGAGKWTAEHAAFFKNARAVILADNDEAGFRHRDDVGRSLEGIAASIRQLDLPEWQPKGDVINWAEAGGTAERLLELITTAAVAWEPRAPAEDDRIGSGVPEYSDDALALKVAQRHQRDLRFVGNSWLVWKGSRWAIDATSTGLQVARAVCREHSKACKLPRVATALASAKTAAAVEKFTKSDPRIAAAAEQFDANPDVFNLPDPEGKP
jgi:DNA primase